MLARFDTTIFDIPPPQAENERDFSLADVFTGSNHARMSVEMLLKLTFINMNSIGIQNNQTNYIFQVPVGDLNKVTEKM